MLVQACTNMYMPLPLDKKAYTSDKTLADPGGQMCNRSDNSVGSGSFKLVAPFQRASQQ